MLLNIVLSVVCLILALLAGYILIKGCKAIHNNLNKLRQIRMVRFLEPSDYKILILLYIGIFIDIAGILGMLFALIYLWK